MGYCFRRTSRDYMDRRRNDIYSDLEGLPVKYKIRVLMRELTAASFWLSMAMFYRQTEM
jgi:hypothetical protein